MHAGELPKYRWSDGREPSTWTSGAVALVATLLLFTSAFLAMTRARELREREAALSAEPPRIVTLAPPVAPPVEKPRAEASREHVPPAVVVRPQTPIAMPIAPAQPTSIVPLAGVPSAPAVSRDSAANARAAADAARDRVLTGIMPRTIHPLPAAPRTLGTPPEPAGVAIHNKKLTLEDIEGVTGSLGVGIAEYVRTHPETAEEREAKNRGSHPPPLQNGPAGDMRRGMTQIPMGSISVPFLSPGLSPEQRKRNAVIDSEYQWRLRRLEDRAALVHDSVRADSLRRDSVARAKRRP